MTTTKTTYEKLVEALKAKGYKYDVIPDGEHYTKVGFKWPKQDTYHWFQFIDGEYPSFVESYSQITGRTIKSRAFRHSYKLKMAIQKKLGIDMYYIPGEIIVGLDEIIKKENL